MESKIKSLLQNKLVAPNVDTNNYSRSIALVLQTYEKDNVCDIKYLDAQSRIRNRERVKVKITNNDDWFPQQGDIVEIEVFQDVVIIIGSVVSDYNTQIRPKNKLKQDIYADGVDSSVGCYIF